MKKKIFGAVLIAAMALAAGWNFNQSKNEVVLSDLALANVEALASGEVKADCGNMAAVICKATCSKCGKTYKTSQSPGPASNVRGNCTCGGRVRAN